MRYRFMAFWWVSGATPAPSFTPTDLSGLAIWHDGADATSVTVDGSNNVTQWSDKSGNNRHVTSADNMTPPVYELKSVNTLNAVKFDGTKVLNSGVLNIPQPFTAFVAFRPVEPCTQTRHLFGRIAGGASVGHFSQFPRYAAGGAIKVGSDKSVIVSDTNVITVLFNGVSSYMNLNLFPAASGSAGSNQLTRNDVGQYFNGHICEILCYSRALTVEEVGQVEGYLATKWTVPPGDPAYVPMLNFSISGNSQYSGAWN